MPSSAQFTRQLPVLKRSALSIFSQTVVSPGCLTDGILLGSFRGAHIQLSPLYEESTHVLLYSRLTLQPQLSSVAVAVADYRVPLDHVAVTLRIGPTAFSNLPACPPPPYLQAEPPPSCSTPSFWRFLFPFHRPNSRACLFIQAY